MSCGVVAGYTNFAASGPVEVPVLEMQIACVEGFAKIAEVLGSKVVRVFTAYEEGGLPPATIWGNVVSSLKECCDRSADHGVAIAIQNHHDIGVHTDSLEEMLSDIDRPNCKLGVDAWLPALRGEALHEIAKRMAPHTAITTSADYVKLPRFHYQEHLVNYLPAEPSMVRAVPFGDGFIDYEAFFSGLKEGGFEGIATFEMCSPLRGRGELENLDFCAKRYLTWMEERNF